MKYKVDKYVRYVNIVNLVLFAKTLNVLQIADTNPDLT